MSVPLAMIGAKEWHDIVCRYDGAKLQMLVDGVWVDEGFPMGALRRENDLKQLGHQRLCQP